MSGALQRHSVTSRIFRITSKKIQSDIILAVSVVFLDEIKEEITQSTFVPLL